MAYSQDIHLRSRKRSNDHYSLVLDAAQSVTEICSEHGLPCAVFGSLAARLYGNSRCPNDVDMLVSEDLNASSISPPRKYPRTAEDIKDLIVRSDSYHFYLKASRKPFADYRILWYRQYYRGPECKVDIVVPGTMHLPHLPRHRSPDETTEYFIPVVPFSLLLTHKLQAWVDHRVAQDLYHRQKQHKDAQDVRILLTIAQALVKWTACIHCVWNDEELFSKEFQILTNLRVRIYCRAFPHLATVWRNIGMDVEIRLANFMKLELEYKELYN
ncbi:hypothetical protein BDN70DRAFT_816597 [Pholiota conissans]|uniref:Uncharacterized protein n=1 Tax=Pholiota conissans TaxID=109636 RepID=A0A9P5YRM3_9AGAR|nr:hypothetical protein BDN70DRAFT_816597 [Pholiota conissans]